MPHYYQASSRAKVDAATATFSDGRVKPGFYEVMADGEYARFGLSMRDEAPAGLNMFDTAATFTDAERRTIIAIAQSDFNLSNAYLGDRAPQFTDAMAQAALATEAQARQQRAAFMTQATNDAAVQYATELTAARMAAEDLNAWRR